MYNYFRNAALVFSRPDRFSKASQGFVPSSALLEWEKSFLSFDDGQGRGSLYIMNIQDLVPEHILAISPYQAGKPIKELEREFGVSNWAKLVANENPLGPSPKAMEAMHAAIREANFYPDGGSFYLRQALAHKHRITPEHIVVGNGSDEVISLFMHTFLTPADTVVLSQYSFVIYQLTAQGMGVELITVPPREDYRHNLDAMADAMTETTKMIFLDNPNNPTGTVIRQEEFAAFLRRVPEHVVIVVDEAYDDYVEIEDFPRSLDAVHEGRRVVVLKTFSKIYGLGGLRLGYGIAPVEFIDAVNRIRSPFNVNALAQAAGVAALEDHDHLRRSRDVTLQGKAWLYKAFEDLHVRYIPSQGNFVTIDLQRNAAPIHQRLMQAGILVCPLNGYGLPHHLRITVGTASQNQRLITALREALTL